MKMNLLLAASCVAIMAAPSMAFCSISNGNDAKDAGKPLVDCWIYPEDGGEGKVVKLEEGAKAPKGYAFQPAPISEAPVSTATDEDSEVVASLKSALTDSQNKLQEAKGEITKLQGNVEEMTKDNAAQADVIGQADAQIEALEDEVADLKAAAEEAAKAPPSAKTTKTVKEPDTDAGNSDGQPAKK